MSDSSASSDSEAYHTADEDCTDDLGNKSCSKSGTEATGKGCEMKATVCVRAPCSPKQRNSKKTSSDRTQTRGEIAQHEHHAVHAQEWQETQTPRGCRTPDWCATQSAPTMQDRGEFTECSVSRSAPQSREKVTGGCSPGRRYKATFDLTYRDEASKAELKGDSQGVIVSTSPYIAGSPMTPAEVASEVRKRACYESVSGARDNPVTKRNAAGGSSATYVSSPTGSVESAGSSSHLGAKERVQKKSTASQSGAGTPQKSIDCRHNDCASRDDEAKLDEQKVGIEECSVPGASIEKNLLSPSGGDMAGMSGKSQVPVRSFAEVVMSPAKPPDSHLQHARQTESPLGRRPEPRKKSPRKGNVAMKKEPENSGRAPCKGETSEQAARKTSNTGRTARNDAGTAVGRIRIANQAATKTTTSRAERQSAQAGNENGPTKPATKIAPNSNQTVIRNGTPDARKPNSIHQEASHAVNARSFKFDKSSQQSTKPCIPDKGDSKSGTPGASSMVKLATAHDVRRPPNTSRVKANGDEASSGIYKDEAATGVSHLSEAKGRGRAGANRARVANQPAGNSGFHNVTQCERRNTTIHAADSSGSFHHKGTAKQAAKSSPNTNQMSGSDGFPKVEELIRGADSHGFEATDKQATRGSDLFQLESSAPNTSEVGENGGGFVKVVMSGKAAPITSDTLQSSGTSKVGNKGCGVAKKVETMNAAAKASSNTIKLGSRGNRAATSAKKETTLNPTSTEPSCRTESGRSGSGVKMAEMTNEAQAKGSASNSKLGSGGNGAVTAGSKAATAEPLQAGRDGPTKKETEHQAASIPPSNIQARRLEAAAKNDAISGVQPTSALSTISAGSNSNGSSKEETTRKAVQSSSFMTKGGSSRGVAPSKAEGSAQATLTPSSTKQEGRNGCGAATSNQAARKPSGFVQEGTCRAVAANENETLVQSTAKPLNTAHGGTSGFVACNKQDKATKQVAGRFPKTTEVANGGVVASTKADTVNQTVVRPSNPTHVGGNSCSPVSKTDMLNQGVRKPPSTSRAGCGNGVAISNVEMSRETAAGPYHPTQVGGKSFMHVPVGKTDMANQAAARQSSDAIQARCINSVAVSKVEMPKQATLVPINQAARNGLGATHGAEIAGQAAKKPFGAIQDGGSSRSASGRRETTQAARSSFNVDQTVSSSSKFVSHEEISVEVLGSTSQVKSSGPGAGTTRNIANTIPTADQGVPGASAVTTSRAGAVIGTGTVSNKATSNGGKCTSVKDEAGPDGVRLIAGLVEEMHKNVCELGEIVNQTPYVFLAGKGLSSEYRNIANSFCAVLQQMTHFCDTLDASQLSSWTEKGACIFKSLAPENLRGISTDVAKCCTKFSEAFAQGKVVLDGGKIKHHVTKEKESSAARLRSIRDSIGHLKHRLAQWMSILQASTSESEPASSTVAPPASSPSKPPEPLPRPVKDTPKATSSSGGMKNVKPQPTFGTTKQDSDGVQPKTDEVPFAQPTASSPCRRILQAVRPSRMRFSKPQPHPVRHKAAVDQASPVHSPVQQMSGRTAPAPLASAVQAPHESHAPRTLAPNFCSPPAQPFVFQRAAPSPAVGSSSPVQSPAASTWAAPKATFQKQDLAKDLSLPNAFKFGNSCTPPNMKSGEAPGFGPLSYDFRLSPFDKMSTQSSLGGVSRPPNTTPPKTRADRFGLGWETAFPPVQSERLDTVTPDRASGGVSDTVDTPQSGCTVEENMKTSPSGTGNSPKQLFISLLDKFNTMCSGWKSKCDAAVDNRRKVDVEKQPDRQQNVTCASRVSTQSEAVKTKPPQTPAAHIDNTPQVTGRTAQQPLYARKWAAAVGTVGSPTRDKKTTAGVEENGKKEREMHSLLVPNKTAQQPLYARKWAAAVGTVGLPTRDEKTTAGVEGNGEKQRETHTLLVPNKTAQQPLYARKWAAGIRRVGSPTRDEKTTAGVKEEGGKVEVAAQRRCGGQDTGENTKSNQAEQEVASNVGKQNEGNGSASDGKKPEHAKQRGGVLCGGISAGGSSAQVQHNVPNCGPVPRTPTSKAKRRLKFADAAEQPGISDSRKQDVSVGKGIPGQSAAKDNRRKPTNAAFSGNEDMGPQLVVQEAVESIDTSLQQRVEVSSNSRNMKAAANSTGKTKSSLCMKESLGSTHNEELQRGNRAKVEKDELPRGRVFPPRRGNAKTAAVPEKSKHSKANVTPTKSENTNQTKIISLAVPTCAVPSPNSTNPNTPAASPGTPKGKHSTPGRRRNKYQYETVTFRKSINCCCEFECDYCIS